MNQQKKNTGKLTGLMMVVIPLAFTVFLVLTGCLLISGMLTPFLETFGWPTLSVTSVLGALLSTVIFKKLYDFLG